MAGMIIAFLPIVIVLLVFQRQLVRGLTRRRGQGMKRARRVARRLPRSWRRAGRASRSSAGNEATAPATTTTTEPPVTAAPGATLPPTTTAPPATTTTTPLASLPPCPVDALDAVTSPVEITFWHGFGAEHETTLTALTDSTTPARRRSM